MVIIRMNIFAVNEQVERPGIGAATARLLTERGTKVLMADVQDERGKAWHASAIPREGNERGAPSGAA
jgi:NAD(P)-dependent dehydrogenase (short-subunit alcohol dehydrogenase family)